jgi:hypothetical protein
VDIRVALENGRRARPAWTARQRGNEAGHRRFGMAVDLAQVDLMRGAAGRAADPQDQ